MIKHIIFGFLLISILTTSFCQDSSFINVHFLYGSKPRSKYKETESKWFGGILGGHVGIECNTDEIINFLPAGNVHWFEQPDEIQSSFKIHSRSSFYKIFSSSDDSIKKAIVIIPVSKRQKIKFDSLSQIYLTESPYDYAFFGMRCGAAAYDILSQMEILEPLSHSKNWRKIFYPKKFREQLFTKAHENNWEVIKMEGSSKRKWER